jgi:hypothetical protein
MIQLHKRIILVSKKEEKTDQITHALTPAADHCLAAPVAAALFPSAPQQLPSSPALASLPVPTWSDRPCRRQLP